LKSYNYFLSNCMRRRIELERSDHLAINQCRSFTSRNCCSRKQTKSGACSWWKDKCWQEQWTRFVQFPWWWRWLTHVHSDAFRNCWRCCQISGWTKIYITESVQTTTETPSYPSYIVSHRTFIQLWRSETLSKKQQAEWWRIWTDACYQAEFGFDAVNVAETLVCMWLVRYLVSSLVCLLKFRINKWNFSVFGNQLQLQF